MSFLVNNQFVGTDPLANAMRSTFNDEEEAPVLSIPEEANEEYVETLVGSDGQYY